MELRGYCSPAQELPAYPTNPAPTILPGMQQESVRRFVKLVEQRKISSCSQILHGIAVRPTVTSPADSDVINQVLIQYATEHYEPRYSPAREPQFLLDLPRAACRPRSAPDMALADALAFSRSVILLRHACLASPHPHQLPKHGKCTSSGRAGRNAGEGGAPPLRSAWSATGRPRAPRGCASVMQVLLRGPGTRPPARPQSPRPCSRLQSTY